MKIRKIYTLDQETIDLIERKRGLASASAFVNNLIKTQLGEPNKTEKEVTQ